MGKRAAPLSLPKAPAKGKTARSLSANEDQAELDSRKLGLFLSDSIDIRKKRRYHLSARHKKLQRRNGCWHTRPLHTERQLHMQPNSRHVAFFIITPVSFFVQRGGKGFEGRGCFFGDTCIWMDRIIRVPCLFYVLYAGGRVWGRGSPNQAAVPRSTLCAPTARLF